MPIGCAQEDGALPILIERTAQIKADADERLESYLWGEGAVVSTGSRRLSARALVSTYQVALGRGGHCLLATFLVVEHAHLGKGRLAWGGTAQRAPVLFGKLFGMVCGMVAAATTRGFVTLGLAAPGAFMFTVGGQAGERGFGTLIRGPFATCCDSVGCEDVCVRPNEWAQQHDTLREHLRGHARSCEVIRGHQRSSKVNKSHQRSSKVNKSLRGHRRSSA